MEQDFAAGASAARNKLASYLRENGFPVQASKYGCPPTDTDFLRSLLGGMNDADYRPDSGVAIVIFKWAYSTYQVAVPASTVQYLAENPERRHDLFSATSSGGGNTLYLAVSNGEVVVHRKKHWSRCDHEPPWLSGMALAGSLRRQARRFFGPEACNNSS
jgi:hypothetical protein